MTQSHYNQEPQTQPEFSGENCVRRAEAHTLCQTGGGFFLSYGGAENVSVTSCRKAAVLPPK